MDAGLDTTFLVQAEVAEHPGHEAAKRKLEELVDGGDRLVLAPQVLSEFIHVVSDSRRFARPLTMPQALERARLWWDAEETRHAFPTVESARLMLDWMLEHRLGRDRILDTQLAATLFTSGVTAIVSSNPRDYTLFGCFRIIVP